MVNYSRWSDNFMPARERVDMEMTPVLWLILGVVLLFVELATPGFIVMFFGLAALTIALITWLLPVGQTMAWLFFALLSVAYILGLRNLLKKILMGDRNAPDRLEDSFIGSYAAVTEAIAPGRPGKVEFSGCQWKAESEAEIGAGERVRIVGKKNLTLTVGR
jgi:inner membrane protein